MKVNYVLLYGTPYLKYKLFDTFEKMSDFIVKRSIVNYTIFEKMDDEKEVEMIYRDSDINVLKENQRLNNIIKELEKWLNDNENNQLFYDYDIELPYIYVDDLLDKIQELKEGK